MKITLERVKRSPRMVDYLSRKLVRIWSGEHMAYWGPRNSGYFDLAGAGFYDGDDAYLTTKHCGPEKKIEFDIVNPEKEKSWEIPEWLRAMTFRIDYSPNCPSPVLIRMPSIRSGGIDGKRYFGFKGDKPGDLTKDQLFFGKTIGDAAARALIAITEKPVTAGVGAFHVNERNIARLMP